MRIRVGDISKINELSLLKNDSFDTILYLDTSNLTENKVDTLQKIDLSIDKLPSRAKRKVRKNTILFSNVRPIQRHYGLLEETPNNLIVSTGFTTLNPDDSVIDEYFLYYLLTQDSTINYLQMIAENSVSSYPSITSNDIADLNFVIPDSIEEQKRTVKIIKLIDQKIALNNQINEELEAMAKTLYDYWFVQFDFPNENGKPYKSSGGKMVYNDQLKREIPEGWGVKPLGELADLYQPQTLSEKDLISNGRYFVYGANGIIGKYNKYNHETPMLAIACRGNSCGVINITQPFSWITGNAMVVKPKFEYICIDYLKYSLLNGNIYKTISGSAQPQITRTNLSPLLLLQADETILSEYADRINSMFSFRIKNFQQNQELTQLRDWLLPMLMNGQVKVE
ncbi:TPA: restriction endonuclease subunit S [Streptococcus suis]|nr:restriction endonuclease subunit S [Streptococcus suis]